MVLQLIFPLSILLLSVWHSAQMNDRNRQALAILSELQRDLIRSNSSDRRRADRQQAAPSQRQATPHKPRQPRAATSERLTKLQQLAASPEWAGAETRYFNLQPDEQPPTTGVQQFARLGFELLTAPVSGRAGSYVVKKRPIAGYTRTVEGQQQQVSSHEAGRRVREQQQQEVTA